MATSYGLISALPKMDLQGVDGWTASRTSPLKRCEDDVAVYVTRVALEFALVGCDDMVCTST